uniref:Uncharacterized protein n=1 Tax=Anopheles minimus TaxID=112268 RepID=A0A182WP85_9DIPT
MGMKGVPHNGILNSLVLLATSQQFNDRYLFCFVPACFA